MKSNIKPQEVEVINAGKRIIRTNIVPHYLPVDESKITQVEVPNMDGEGTHLETMYPEPEIDYWTYDERIEYLPCYALLTFGQYFDLNCKLSLLQGFDLNKPTERVWTMNPPACKVNIQVDEQGNETYDTKLVAYISSNDQINYPELFDGIELVDSYIPVDQPIQEALVDITSIETLNWTLMQFSVAGAKEDLKLIISPETMEIITPEFISVIEDLGLTVDA